VFTTLVVTHVWCHLVEVNVPISWRATRVSGKTNEDHLRVASLGLIIFGLNLIASKIPLVLRKGYEKMRASLSREP